MNTVLKLCHAVLSQLSLDVTFTHHMKLEEASTFLTKDLMPPDPIVTVAKSSQVSRDEAV